MVNFDCTAMWSVNGIKRVVIISNNFIGSYFHFRVKNCETLHRTFNVEPLYLRHENSGISIVFFAKPKTRKRP